MSPTSQPKSIAGNPRIAVVLSAINVRRILPGLRSFVAAGRDYWLVDIYRQPADLRQLLEDWQPAALLTEWIPELTPEFLIADLPTLVITDRQKSAKYWSLDVENHEVGRMAADYFLRGRWSNIAFFGNETPYSKEREAGFKAALTGKSITYQRFIQKSGMQRQYIEHWHESDIDLGEWLQRLEKPVAVFAAHDPLGRTLAEACRDRDISIPEAVSILGVNNDELVCEMTNPPLSSIAIPWDQLGYRAGACLESVLKSASKNIQPQKLDDLLPGEILERGSTKLTALVDPQLRRALSWMRENACTGKSIGDMVNELRIARRSLENAFKKQLLRSPREEMMRLRIERAKSLLRRTDWNLAIISEHCGFSSAELFSVNFKKQTGDSPGSFRRKARI
jgi:LacI family transcriptional regulator